MYKKSPLLGAFLSFVTKNLHRNEIKSIRSYLEETILLWKTFMAATPGSFLSFIFTTTL